MWLPRPPKYLPEVLQAIYELKDKHGSNVQRIVSYIENKLKNSVRPHPPMRNISMQVRRALKAVLETGEVQECAGLFRLSRARGGAGGGRIKKTSSKRRRKQPQADRRKSRDSREAKSRRSSGSTNRSTPPKRRQHEERASAFSRRKPKKDRDKRNQRRKSYSKAASSSRGDSKLNKSRTRTRSRSRSRSNHSKDDDGRRRRHHYRSNDKHRDHRHRRGSVERGRSSRHHKKRHSDTKHRSLKNRPNKRKRASSKVSRPTSRASSMIRAKKTKKSKPYGKRVKRTARRRNVDQPPRLSTYAPHRRRRRMSGQHKPVRPEYTIDPNVLNDMNPTDCSTANEPNNPKASGSGVGGDGGNNSNDPDTDTGRDDKDVYISDCGDPHTLFNSGDEDKTSSEKKATNTE